MVKILKSEKAEPLNQDEVNSVLRTVTKHGVPPINVPDAFQPKDLSLRFGKQVWPKIKSMSRVSYETDYVMHMFYSNIINTLLKK